MDKVRARYFTPQDKGLGGFQSPWIRFAPNMSKFELSTESAFQSPWIRFAQCSKLLHYGNNLRVSIPVDKVRAYF